MNENKQRHHQHPDSHKGEGHHDHRPYWKRAHKDWRVIVVIVLMLVCMFIYIVSEDLALQPRG